MSILKEIYKSIINVFKNDLESWDNKDNSSKSISKDKLKQKFDRSNPLYKPIKITNILLFFILIFIEINLAIVVGRNASVFPVLICFIFSRTAIRSRFKANPNFKNKVAFTVGVWLSVYFIYQIVASVFLLLILNSI